MRSYTITRVKEENLLDGVLQNGLDNYVCDEYTSL